MSSFFHDYHRDALEKAYAEDVLRQLEGQSEDGTLYRHLEKSLIPDAGYLESVLRVAWKKSQHTADFPFEVTTLGDDPLEIKIERKRD